MKLFFAYLLIGLAALAGLLGLSWIFGGNALLYQRVFAPEFEQVRRDTFEQSKAYRDGAVQELRAMQFSYLQADPAHRAGLASVIRHKAAGVPQDALPADLHAFIKELP